MTDKLNSIETPLAAFPLFIAVHLWAEQPDTVASQSIVVSYKINPPLPPIAPVEIIF